MSRKTLSVVGALTLCGLLIALAAPVGASGRTLHSNELWDRFGGDEIFFGRDCDEIEDCDLEDECSEFAAGFNCRFWGFEDEATGGNTEGCNFSGDPEDICEEVGIVNCKGRWRCRSELGQCVKDTFHPPAYEQAPEECNELEA